MNRLNRNGLRGSLLLLAATLIWGNAFVAQSIGMEAMGPFTFQAIRCMLAVLFLFPASIIFSCRKTGFREAFSSWSNPRLWKAGFICGLALFVAVSMQQISLADTDSGKAGFITAMYIVIVPILGFFFHRIPGLNAYFGVAFSVIGLYLLSCFGVSQIRTSDLLLLGCAFFFSVQILLVDRMAPGLSGIQLNCIQAFVTAVLSGILALTTETVEIHDIASCWFPLCFAGILSMGAAYTLQIEGQKLLEPTTASIIMSTESVFAALGGWLILHQKMSFHELCGCLLVFTGIIVSQLPASIFGKIHKSM